LIFYTTLCDNVCQWIAAGQLLSLCTLFNIIWSHLSVTSGRSIVFSRYIDLIYYINNWQLLDKWHIVERSIMYNNTRIIWSSRPRYWYYQYYNIHNTGNTSIVNITILVIPVSYIYNTGCTSIVHLQYWNTRIVDLCTIPEAPVFFIQQYW
jgi:hypothetical protein